MASTNHDNNKGIDHPVTTVEIVTGKSPAEDQYYYSEAVGEKVQTPELSYSSSSSSELSESSRVDASKIVLFLSGAILGVAIAMVVVAMQIGRRRRRSRRGNSSSNRRHNKHNHDIPKNSEMTRIRHEDVSGNERKGFTIPTIFSNTIHSEVNNWLGGIGFDDVVVDDDSSTDFDVEYGFFDDEGENKDDDDDDFDSLVNKWATTTTTTTEKKATEKPHYHIII